MVFTTSKANSWAIIKTCVANTMKPVLILQHMRADSPAYLATWLHGQGVAFTVCDSERGDVVPADIHGFSALALLGGEMSANDDLPALRQAEVLIRQAQARAVPTLGHCLGGQLMARALGARVVDSPKPELGWHAMHIHDSDAARAWLGEPGNALVFQWHYDSFELPRGATLLASSTACPRQAFAVGPHVALQFHVELDAAKLAHWAGEAETDTRVLSAQAEFDTVQGATRMLAAQQERLAAQQRLADRIYARWLSTAAS